MTRGEPAPGSDTCPRCGFGLFERHCKLVCEQCGIVRDCADPF
ncbi:MAG: hypothetical protein ABEJ27_00845 [Halodesulfurarchaeum sp.]